MSSHPLHAPLAALLIAFGFALTPAQAQQAPAAAPALDPAKLMQGLPPAPEYQIHIGNWQQSPQKIWSFQNVRELFPTRRLEPRGPVWVLPEARRPLDQLAVGTPDAPMSWPQMLAASHTDAVLVLHKGRIVDERYTNGMRPATPHLMFSATKSLVGLMGATLIAEGKLAGNAQVGSLIPELAQSAWSGATVQQVLDMTDAVRFTEIYTDPKSDIFAYVGAMGWAPQFANPANPSGILGMLPTLKTVHEEPRGSAFRYRSPSTDVAAWVAGRAAGQNFTSWMQDRLWSRMGMEHDGSVMLDPRGTEVAFAGMSASLRDLGRIGQMLLQRGVVRGEQIVPAVVVDDLIRGGDPKAFAAAKMPNREGWSYRNQWWINPAAPRFFAAMGAYGQRIFVLPDSEMVVVMLSSHPLPIAALIDPAHQRALAALAKELAPASQR